MKEYAGVYQVEATQEQSPKGSLTSPTHFGRNDLAERVCSVTCPVEAAPQLRESPVVA